MFQAIAFLIAFLVSIVPISIGQAANSPNLIVILVDDLGANELGCYGHPTNRTPNIDRLADEGMRFQTCFATPICSPSRVLLLTGRYGVRTGWYNFAGRPGSSTQQNPDYDLGRAETTFAHLLKDQGYVTGIAGRWLEYGYEHRQIPRAGFDEHFVWGIWGNRLPADVEHTGAWQNEELGVTSRYWHPCLIHDGRYVSTTPSDYGPDLINEFCRGFISRHRDRPFLLFYPMILEHDPYDPVPDVERRGQRKAGNLQSFVDYTDHLIGKLIAELDESGLRRNTIIFFMGDNGTVRAGKATATERGARVPLIVSCPGKVKSSTVTDALTDLSDVLPTLAAYAGAPLPEDLYIDGRNLGPTLAGKSLVHRDWIFSYLHDKRILRDSRWLLEGDGRFFDCGNSRNGDDYKDVTSSQDVEVRAARQRFETILREYPAPILEADPLLDKQERLLRSERPHRATRAVLGPPIHAVPRESN